MGILAMRAAVRGECPGQSSPCLLARPMGPLNRSNGLRFADSASGSAAYTRRMAWNIVIVGGGFAGANVARHLEKVLPWQSSRLTGQRRQLRFSTPLVWKPPPAPSSRAMVTRSNLFSDEPRLGWLTPMTGSPRSDPAKPHGPDQRIPYDHLVLAPGSISRFCRSPA